MKVLFLLASLAISVLADDLAPAITGCPTITTNKPCSTCVAPQCLAISTIVNPCGCPKQVPTSVKDWPCKESKCPGGCAGTTWSVIPETKCPRSTGCPTITRTVRAPDCTPPPHPGAKVCQELKCLSQIPVTIPCSCNDIKVPTTTVTGPCTCQSGCATISEAVRVPACPTRVTAPAV